MVYAKSYSYRLQDLYGCTVDGLLYGIVEDRIYVSGYYISTDGRVEIIISVGHSTYRGCDYRILGSADRNA